MKPTASPGRSSRSVLVGILLFALVAIPGYLFLNQQSSDIAAQTPAKAKARAKAQAPAAQPPAAQPPAGQPANEPAAKPTVKKGERIAVIGNSLADRMQHDGWFDAYVQTRYPDASIRHMGYSADEVGGFTDKPDNSKRLRSASFGSNDTWMKHVKADVVFAFFGYNESWGGEAGRKAFRDQLDAFVKHTLKQNYSGNGTARLVLFTPTAAEAAKGRDLPDVEATNARLKLYAEDVLTVAKQNGVAAVDLFTPTVKQFAEAKEPLTINGVHLSETGYEELAKIIDAAFGDPITRDTKTLTAVREAAKDRNFHWYNRFRTTDGFSIYGGRSGLKFTGGQTNYVVAQREMLILDEMTTNRDKVVSAAAKGEAAKVDDSKTSEFLPVVTNRPGKLPGGKHAFQDGKEAIANMKLGKGIKVNLFADEKMFPELANPVQMAWDAKGRLWVACWPTYPHWKPKEPMNDKLIILEDTDGDGVADKKTVFADNLHNPTGFDFHNGGVIVAQAPDLIFLKDTDGDGKADLRIRLAQGLDTADTHHTSNSFVRDPGGALYFQEGTFHHSQTETPYGPPARVANGGVFRYEPKTQKFEIYVSYGFANPHGHVFNNWGQDIVVDGTGANPYHAVLFNGYLPFPHKHSGVPQVYKQRTRPCGGIEYYTSNHFPPEFHGNLLVTNCIGFQGVLRYKIEDEGGSYKGTELEPLLSSSDPNFRPVDAKVGPDGAVYIADWQNPIIGHMQHNLRDPSRDREHGRIYRVTYEGRDLVKPVKIDGEPLPALLDLLKSNDDRVRYRAKLEMSGRKSDEVIAAAQSWLAKLDPMDKDYEHQRTEALWVHQYHNVVNKELLESVLASKEPNARAAAVRVLTYWRDRVPGGLDLMRTAVNDPHPRVRLEAVRGLSFFPPADALPVLIDVLAQPNDRFVTHVFKETLRSIELQTGEKTAGGIAGTLVKLLAGGKVPVDRQANYVDAIVRQGSAAELKAVWETVVSAETLPVELRKLAVDGIADAAINRKVTPATKPDVKPLLASKDAGIRQAAVRLAGAWQATDAAGEVRKLAAAETEPLDVRIASVAALGNLADADSKAALKELLKDKSTRVRYEAIATLVRGDLDSASAPAAEALATVVPGDEIGVVIDAFLTRKGGPEKLAEAIGKSKISEDAAKLALRYMYGAGRNDAGLSDVLTKAAKLDTVKPLTPAEIKALVPEVTTKGDAARGEAIFRRAELNCYKCHALVNKAGGNIGPELSAIGKDNPTEYVIESILDPNAKIKETYVTRVITTVDEQIYTGVQVSKDNQQIVLRDANGKLITIPLKNIDTNKDGRSLMPDGLTKFLTRQELLDLSRFLAELGKPGPYAIATPNTVQRWKILRPADQASHKEVLSDENFARLVLKAKPELWDRAYSTFAGQLPFAELRQTGKGDIVYAQGEIIVDRTGTITVDAKGNHSGIWVDGKALAKDGNGQVNVTAGRHTITARLDTAANPTGNVRVEISKPKDSAIAIEVVSGQ